MYGGGGGVRGGTLFFSAGPCFYSFTVLVLELNLSCVLCVLQRKVSCWCLLMCQSMYVKMTLTESRVASHMWWPLKEQPVILECDDKSLVHVHHLKSLLLCLFICKSSPNSIKCLLGFEETHTDYDVKVTFSSVMEQKIVQQTSNMSSVSALSCWTLFWRWWSMKGFSFWHLQITFLLAF